LLSRSEGKERSAPLYYKITKKKYFLFIGAGRSRRPSRILGLLEPRRHGQEQVDVAVAARQSEEREGNTPAQRCRHIGTRGTALQQPSTRGGGTRGTTGCPRIQQCDGGTVGRIQGASTVDGVSSAAALPGSARRSQPSHPESFRRRSQRSRPESRASFVILHPPLALASADGIPAPATAPRDTKGVWGQRTINAPRRCRRSRSFGRSPFRASHCHHPLRPLVLSFLLALLLHSVLARQRTTCAIMPGPRHRSNAITALPPSASAHTATIFAHPRCHPRRPPPRNAFPPPLPPPHHIIPFFQKLVTPPNPPLPLLTPQPPLPPPLTGHLGSRFLYSWHS
jgi:hypothetical protein